MRTREDYHIYDEAKNGKRRIPGIWGSKKRKEYKPHRPRNTDLIKLTDPRTD